MKVDLQHIVICREFDQNREKEEEYKNLAKKFNNEISKGVINCVWLVLVD